MKIFIVSNFAIQVVIFCWYEQKVSNPRRCSNLKDCLSWKKILLIFYAILLEKRHRSTYYYLPTFAFLQKRILCSLSYINMPILMSMLRDFPYFLHTLSTFLFKASFFSNHTLNRLSTTVNDVLTEVSFEYNFTSLNCFTQKLEIFGDLKISFLDE